MIAFITGVPGSGKTYLGMYALFSNFAINKTIIKDKRFIKKGIKKALTNINEIKLENFENVHSLNWEEFKENLNTLYLEYKQNSTDSQLIDIAKELGIFDTFILLDECHNYLDNQDKVLIWWLSYHRHLHQEIYLLTQNLSLVNTKYKSFSEFFYKAHSASIKLFNNKMKYNHYIDSRMSLKSKVNTISIPIQKEVFSSYVSGKNQKPKSVVLKYFIYAFVFVLIFFLMIKFSFSSSSNNEEKIETDSSVEQHKTQIIQTEEKEVLPDYSEIKEYKFMSLKCSLKYKYCLYNDHKIQINTYYKLKEIFNIQELSINKLENNFMQLDILADSKFFDIFNGGKDEEETTDNSDDFNIISN